MNEQIIAKRYGEGYMLFVKNYININTAVEELLVFKRLLKESPQFLKFLNNTAISEKEKELFINKIFENNFSNELTIFIKFLITKKETTNLPIILEYLRITYSHGASVNAVMTSTYPLDDDVIEKIKEKMEKITQKKINLYMDFDTNLIGGIKFTIGNVVYDGSIKGNLDRIRKKLKQIQVSR